MRSWLGVIAIALFAAGGTVLGGDSKEAGEKDLKKIQGTWQFVAQEMEGKQRPKEEVAKLTITFTGDKFAVREADKVVQAGTHKLDPTKKPAQVTAMVTEGQGKGSTMLGIYEVSGDTMKVCFDPQGKERPSSFSAKGSQFSAVIQRVKKKP
jgi:uncharacterized protein (TIGR03067 family)